MDIQQVCQAQRAYFRTGETLDARFRLDALRNLRAEIIRRERDIAQALREDLGKSAFEGYMTEIGMALDELAYMIRHAGRFARPRRVPTPLAQFAGRSYILPKPYGCALIMSPWNYPFLLSVSPLIDALAAGNTAIVKPSAYASQTSAALRALAAACFPPEYVAVVEGGRAQNAALLEEKFDYIFFTGSKEVGRLVMEKAARHITPVTLELGGKSPCIVDDTADIDCAARRIVFGKFLNCGQTCVAPDYVLAHTSVKDALVAAMRREIARQYGQDPLANANYGRIINHKHFTRLTGLLTDEAGRVYGGRTDAPGLRIEPTLIDGATMDSPAMREEIFGPILPVLTFESMTDVPGMVARHPTPLALYLFTKSRANKRFIHRAVSFGGGCVNDTIIHLATTRMPFGGVGDSGMGAYHGKAGFDTFTHYAGVAEKSAALDMPIRYQPYDKQKERLLRRFLR